MVAASPRTSIAARHPREDSMTTATTARRLLAGASIAMTTLLAACGGGGGGSSPPPPPACVSPCINAAGGTVTGPNGAAVTVPAGALSGNVTISVSSGGTSPPAAVPLQFESAGTVYAFEPRGTTFATPVTITVPLDPAQIGSGDTPQLIHIGSGQSNWSVVSGATRSGNAMTAQVSSFSWFVVVKAATLPSITTQPADAAVTVGNTASFAVAAAGSAPLAYQWQRNGTEIAGATAAAYTTAATVAGDNGAKFRVVVSNGAGNVLSNEATLTVNPVINTIDLRGLANYCNQCTYFPWVATDEMMLFDATGAQRSTQVSADGRFTFADIGGLTAPFLLAAYGANDTPYGYTAVIRDKPGASRDIYVTYTGVAVAAAALGKSTFALASSPAVAAESAKQLTTVNIDAALAKFRITFSQVLPALGADPAIFDPAIDPKSIALDDITQKLGETATGETRFINGNARLPADTGVTFTLLGTALPPAVIGDSGFTKPLMRAFDECFKLPVADRATVDANGVITALKGACASLPVAANYSQNLATFAQRYWDWLLDPATQGNYFGTFTMGVTDNNEPVIGLFHFNPSAGGSDFKYDTMARTAPGTTTFHLLGNQRKYELFVQTEVRRTMYLNPVPAAPTSIFGISHIASGLHFRFDPTRNAASAEVVAIRVTGRGLPAAGLVLTRSTSCDRVDRFVIANKTATPTTSSGNRSSTFLLAAGPATAGGPLGPWTGLDPSFADAPLTDAQFSEFRSLDPYRWEIFKAGDPPTAPSEVIVTRNGNPPLPPSIYLGSVGWTDITPATRAYFDPTAAQAAASVTLPMEWTIGTPMFPGRYSTAIPTSVYAFTRGNIDGVVNKRVNDGFDFPPSSRTNVLFRSDTAVTGETIPCTGSAFPPLTNTPSTFRGMGLFWSNRTVRFLSEHQYQGF
jgi:hypothetical protein